MASCIWALLVQCALAKTVKYMKARSAQGKAEVRINGRNSPKAKAAASVFAAAPQVEVHVVNPAIAQIFVDAIEGAAYVDDPLTYLIETLTADQRRLDLTKTILSKLRMLNPRHRKASQLQRIYRAYRARRILAQVAAPSTAAAMV